MEKILQNQEVYGKKLYFLTKLVQSRFYKKGPFLKPTVLGTKVDRSTFSSQGVLGAEANQGCLAGSSWQIGAQAQV